MRILLNILIVVVLPFLLAAQTIYDPQLLYDVAGGFYDKDSLRNIHIQFENPDYHDLLVDAFFNDPSHRIPATVTLNGVAHDSVGVRYKGNSTFCLPNDAGSPKVPFNLDMNHWVSGQKLMGYKKIKLANGWLDPTMAKEFAAAQIYRRYLPCPEVNLAKLHVQGDYLGLYVNTESVNKQFLQKHFDEKNGVLFKCDGAAVFCGSSTGGRPDLNWVGSDSTAYYNRYTIKSDHGWAALLDLIYKLSFDPDELENVLNIDRVLWAFAVNTAIGNYDTYNGYYVHNYYLYRTEDGLFQMIPWDLDNSFIGALMGNSYWTPEDVYEFDPFFGQDSIDYGNQQMVWRPLTGFLFNHPKYRKQYTAHLRTIIDESLDTAAIRSQIEQLQSLSSNAFATDNNNAFPTDLFYTNVEEAIWVGWGFGGILSTVEARKEYLLSHPEIALSPPALSEVALSNNVLTVVASNETLVELMATTSPHQSQFQPFPMYDDGTNGDATPGDGIYSAMLPFGGSPELKFYIRAENDEAMALSPPRAEYEFYTPSTMTDLVGANLAPSLSLYPNPTRQEIVIDRGSATRLNYALYSPLGERISSGVFEGQRAVLDLSNLPKGAYILKTAGRSYKILKVE